MRVVAGSARGRRLESPPGSAVRPTGDRVREAAFNALVSLEAQEGLVILEGASVLDLFTGSGAMGVEALSRGADHVVFVDQARSVLEVARRNVAACGFDDRSELVCSDALGYLGRRRGDAHDPDHEPLGRPFDLAVLDPPYAFGAWDELFALLDAVVLVIESDRPVDPPSRWAVVRQRSYGATVVTIAVGRPAPRPGGPTP